MKNKLRIVVIFLASLLATAFANSSAADIALLENYVEENILSATRQTLKDINPVESLQVFGVALGANQRNGGIDIETFKEFDSEMRENIQALAAFAGDKQEAATRKLTQLYEKALAGEKDKDTEERYGIQINSLPPINAKIAETHGLLHKDRSTPPPQIVNSLPEKKRVIEEVIVVPESLTTSDKDSLLATANQIFVSTKAIDLDTLNAITIGKANASIVELQEDEDNRESFRAMAQTLDSWNFGEPKKVENKDAIKIAARMVMSTGEAMYLELFFEKHGSSWKMSDSDELNEESAEAQSLDPKYRELSKEIKQRLNAFMNHLKQFRLSGMLEYTDDDAREDLLDILSDREEMAEIKELLKNLQWEILSIQFGDTETAEVTIQISTLSDKNESADLQFNLVNGQWLIVDFDLF